MKRTSWQYSLRAVLLIVTAWALILSVWKIAGLRAVSGLFVLVLSIASMRLAWHANENLGIIARVLAAFVVGLIVGLVATMALSFVLVDYVWL